MIQVKTFRTKSQNPVHLGKLDDAINAFLQENDIEVIDIKYDTAAVDSNGQMNFYPSALLIYKTKE